MKRGLRYFLIPVFFLLLLSNVVSADTLMPGFVPGDIWYSKDPFKAGEEIKIYTAIFNPSDRKFMGIVSFYNEDTLLGKKNFEIAPNQIQNVYIDYKVTAGAHAIYARIENSKFLNPNGTFETVNIETSETSKVRRIVTIDVINELGNINNKIENSVEGISTPVTNIKQKILESTPNYIKTPIINTVESLEDYRAKTREKLEVQKENLKTELNIKNQGDILENSIPPELGGTTSETAESENKNKDAPKPVLAYLKYFLVTLIAFVFANKILFYFGFILLAFLIFVIIWRLIWRR